MENLVSLRVGLTFIGGKMPHHDGRWRSIYVWRRNREGGPRNQRFCGIKDLQHGPVKSELSVMVHMPPSPGHDVVVVVVGVVVIVTVDSIQRQSVLMNPPPCLVQLAHTEHAPEQVPDAAALVFEPFVVVVVEVFVVAFDGLVVGRLLVVVVFVVPVFHRLSLALIRLVAAGARTVTGCGGKWAEQNCSAGE
jgi:hypothetical protein